MVYAWLMSIYNLNQNMCWEMFGMKSHVRALRQPSYHWRMERKEIKHYAIHVCKWSETMTLEQHAKLTYQHLLSWMAHQQCRNVKKYVSTTRYNSHQQPIALSSEGSSGAWLNPLRKLLGWKEGDPQRQCTWNLKQLEHSNKQTFQFLSPLTPCHVTCPVCTL